MTGLKGNEMGLKANTRVRHPKMEPWGVGMVLEDSDGLSVRVFFEHVGEKCLSLSHVQIEEIGGDAAASSVLDNLKVADGIVSPHYQSLRASTDSFLRKFPGGFTGDRFKLHERDHKDEIHEKMRLQLGPDVMSELLKARAYAEICDRALKMTGVRANAMIFKNEKMALRDGLRSPEAQERFAIGLNEILHGDGQFDEGFEHFVTILEEIGAAKWTIATYFLFFSDPQRHMFVKPTITRNAAEVCAFEIGYRPELNAATYRSVMRFSEYLRKQLAELGPRDMIDVQSFMWCIAPGKYQS